MVALHLDRVNLERGEAGNVTPPYELRPALPSARVGAISGNGVLGARC
jgi:hypothetical protein